MQQIPAAELSFPMRIIRHRFVQEDIADKQTLDMHTDKAES